MRIWIGNLGAIYRRELQSYFVSPLAYAIAGVFWLLTGLLFWLVLLGPTGIIEQANQIDSCGAQCREQWAQMGMLIPTTIDVPYEFLQAFLQIMASLSLFILPILSMNLYAEERKRRTLELLATSPITNWAVAVAKLLGVFTFYTVMVAPLLLCEIIAFNASEPMMPPTVPILGHVALLLLAASILSLGMFISCLSESTIFAAMMTFAVVLLMSSMDALATWLSNLNSPFFPQIGAIVGYLALQKHYGTLIKGVWDTSSVMMFITYIILGVFLTAQYIEALRFGRS
jgi:ABC-2 type transport system permease protein